MNFHIIVSEGEDGWLIAECPALPGCMTQGKDELELMRNMKEAILGWLEVEDEKAIGAARSRGIEGKELALAI